MKNEKGFSLVELLVVISIAAILIGGMAVSINFLTYEETTKCTKGINYAISNLRVEALNKGTLYCYLVISWDNTDEEYYMRKAISEEELNEINWSEKAISISHPTRIGTGRINISYTRQSDGTGNVNLREDTPLLISFKADSGAFESDWKQITVTSKDMTSTIYMVTKTGNHYIGE